MDDITGRIALVTGASRGIGRAIAVALARAGADVAVHYGASHHDADAAVAEIRALGRRAVAVRADLARAEEAAGLVDAVVGALGDVQILVNNAGIAGPKPIDALTLDDWNRHVAVNLTASFIVTQAALPAMRRARWGRLIEVSSVAAQTGGVIGPHYAATKAGQIGLMHAYARMLVAEGITANAIAPGRIDTDMVRRDTVSNRAAMAVPVGRHGSVEEVAAVAVLLARNGYMTGQTINVNGGLNPSS